MPVFLRLRMRFFHDARRWRRSGLGRPARMEMGLFHHGASCAEPSSLILTELLRVGSCSVTERVTKADHTLVTVCSPPVRIIRPPAHGSSVRICAFPKWINNVSEQNLGEHADLCVHARAGARFGGLRKKKKKLNQGHGRRAAPPANPPRRRL